MIHQNTIKIKKVVDIFIQLRNIYAKLGDFYRVQAYNNAINSLLSKKTIDCLSMKLKKKAETIIETGELHELKTLQRYEKLIGVIGFGIKTIKKMMKEAVPKLNRVQKLGLKWYKRMKHRIPRNEIKEIVKRLMKTLQFKSIYIVGSFRRKLSDSGDIDLLIKDVNINIDKLIDYLKDDERYIDYITAGKKKISFLYFWSNMQNVIQVDMRFFNEQSFPTALMYFTGSKEFNVKIRAIAKLRGFKLNEYGLFTSLGKRVFVKNERDIFWILGIKYIAPEKRTPDVKLIVKNIK